VSGSKLLDRLVAGRPRPVGLGARSVFSRSGSTRALRADPENRRASAGTLHRPPTRGVSKRRFVVLLPVSEVPIGSICSIARNNDTSFGILHWGFHEDRALRQGNLQ